MLLLLLLLLLLPLLLGVVLPRATGCIKHDIPEAQNHLWRFPNPPDDAQALWMSLLFEGGSGGGGRGSIVVRSGCAALSVWVANWDCLPVTALKVARTMARMKVHDSRMLLMLAVHMSVKWAAFLT